MWLESLAVCSTLLQRLYTWQIFSRFCSFKTDSKISVLTSVTHSLGRVTSYGFEITSGCHSWLENVSGLRWLNRVMRDHEAHASAINRKWIFIFFLVFSRLKLLKHNKQGPILALQQSPLKSRLLVKQSHFFTSVWLWFQFCSISYGEIIRHPRTG